jgi:hypothetical protein
MLVAFGLSEFLIGHEIGDGHLGLSSWQHVLLCAVPALILSIAVKRRLTT